MMESSEIRKLLNEIQVFLHAHPVNRRREENNRALINSLWLWGGGTLPTVPAATNFDGSWSKDPLARGLARAADIPAHHLPESADALLADARSGTRPLVVLDDLTGPVCYENCADYRQTLATLETCWFAPAWRALAAGAIKRLRLAAPTAYGTLSWDGDRFVPWRFWRRPQTLSETAKALVSGKIGERDET
jgi:hypothetical protein